MNCEEKKPHLAGFLGAYFHQDWALEGLAPQQIVDTYVRETPPQETEMVMQEVRELLDGGATEPELRSCLYQLGCYFEPWSAGQSASEWLRTLLTGLVRPSPKSM